MTGPAPHSRRGFTLVESMAAVVVLATLGSIASFLIVDTVEHCMDATISAQVHAELSVAMERVAREIRKIELEPGNGVAPNITTVLSNYIGWADSGSDAYEMSYAALEDRLKLKVDGGTLAVLLTDVTGCTVSTYDQDGAQLPWILSDADADDVRRVRVDVTVERGGVTEVLHAKADIRSTMYGAE